MKKQLTAVLLLFVLLLTMAGCSTANALQKLDAAEEIAEEKLDAVEDKLEAGLRNAVSPAPAAPAETRPVPAEMPPAPAETQPAPVEVIPEPTAPAVSVPAAPAEAEKLTKEQAQQIALDHLGFTADQVTRLRVEYEIDDGMPQYDVEFLQGDWEYEFEIHAENGKILSYDKDHKYD